MDSQLDTTDESGRELFLIDDFTDEEQISQLGTTWRAFSDQVMGGVSTVGYEYVTLESADDQEQETIRALHLLGEVSLENNGGFAQVALSLVQDEKPFDASKYAGVRLHVKGNAETYFVHLRTNQTRLPWQYYGGSFKAGESWQTIDIPFNDFTGESISDPLNLEFLLSIGIVAAQKPYRADLFIDSVAFYS